MSLKDPKLKKTAERIGEKMRHIRNTRGLTQRELAVGSVSRNMLSMIESGTALPSIETLLHISDVLSVPTGYFFAEGDEEMLYGKRESILTVYSLFNEKKYEEAAAVCEPYIDHDGEMRLCYSLSHLQIASAFLDKYMLASAYAHLEIAASSAEDIPFGGRHITDICKFIMRLSDSVSSESVPDDLVKREDLADSLIPTVFVVYLTAYKALKNGDPECASAILRSGILSGFHALHIRGAVLMASGDYDGATRLFDLALSSDEGGFYSKYKLLCDLEFCRKSAGDYEAAYSLSTSRMEMLGIFSK